MDVHDNFIQHAMNAGKQFQEEQEKNKQSVLLIGHFDTDGLASTVLAKKALEKENIDVEVIIKQHVDDEYIEELKKAEQDIILLVDVGANKEEALAQTNKKIIILDHHNPQYSEEHKIAENVIHINPFLHGLTERNTISGAGVVYYFSLGMNPENKSLAHLAVLGAIGDTQERNGFEALNNNILQHAIVQRTIQVGKRLRLYGINSRSLVKVLQYSTDLSIPGVTNNEEGVRALLRNLRISTEWKGRPRKYFNLFDDEKERLLDKILELKKDEDIENVLVPSYTLLNERKRSFQDLKEYATIINACGRLGEYETGMKAMLGDYDAQDKAIMNLRVYKNAIREAFIFIDEAKEQGHEDYILGDHYVIINLRNRIQSSLVGIVASILARNKHYDAGTIVCTLAEQKDDTVKVSLRVSGDSEERNVQETLQTVCTELGLVSGGHKNAAGAVITKEQEKEFLRLLEEEFKK